MERVQQASSVSIRGVICNLCNMHRRRTVHDYRSSRHWILCRDADGSQTHGWHWVSQWGIGKSLTALRFTHVHRRSPRRSSCGWRGWDPLFLLLEHHHFLLVGLSPHHPLQMAISSGAQILQLLLGLPGSPHSMNFIHWGWQALSCPPPAVPWALQIHLSPQFFLKFAAISKDLIQLSRPAFKCHVLREVFRDDFLYI